MQADRARRATEAGFAKGSSKFLCKERMDIPSCKVGGEVLSVSGIDLLDRGDCGARLVAQARTNGADGDREIVVDDVGC